MPDYYNYYDYEQYDRVGRLGDYYYYYEDDYYPDPPSARSPAPQVPTIHPLAALIAPLAGLALMGAAAAVAVNPMLLQLAVISKNGRRRRRRRETGGGLERGLKQMRVVDRYLSSLPEGAGQDISARLTVEFLACSGLGSSTCLELLTCQYSGGGVERVERDVVSVILYHLMSNKLLPSDLKTRLRGAAKLGRDNGDCGQTFSCNYGINQ